MSARPVDVAVLQFDATPGDVPGNLQRLLDLVATVGTDADLVVAPELAVPGYDLDLIEERGHELAEPVNGPSISRLVEACADVGTTLTIGFLEVADDRLYDSVATITQSGTVEVYRKTHLFPAELPLFAAGSQLVTIPSPVGLLGPLICFEHAFPEVATALALRGAEILLIPSAVPIGFEYLLSLRTRARAQDNQVFAVASNMTGHGFCGGSLIADPRGDVLAAADKEETVLRARLDLASVGRERDQEPALRMRRPGLYGDQPAEQ